MIELRDVHKRLGDFAVHGVSLVVGDREYYVVLGPTGSGKTVLLECIAGLYSVDRGQVFIDGHDATSLPPERRRISYVPQDYVLFPHLPVRKNIAFSLQLQRWDDARIRSRVSELAEMLNIAHLLDRAPRTLSGGEQQRTALARALAPGPTALLLDEPLSALDENTREIIGSELKSLPERFGTTVLHVCHNFEEALRLATRIAVVYSGRVIQAGTPDEIFAQPNCRFVAEFMRVRNILPVAKLLREGDDALCTLDSGQRLRVAGAPHITGATVLTVRPETVIVEPRTDGTEGQASQPPRPNAVPAVVEEAEAMGSVAELALAADGLKLRAIMARQSLSLGHVAVGAEVWATLPPEACHLAPDSVMPPGMEKDS